MFKKIEQEHVEILRTFINEQVKIGPLNDLEVAIPAEEVGGLIEYIDTLKQQIDILKNPRVQDSDVD